MVTLLHALNEETKRVYDDNINCLIDNKLYTQSNIIDLLN